MAAFPIVLFAFLAAQSACQSINNLGSVGGSGPTGGIGDKAHPVLQAQSFVTDALYPSAPNTTRQLAKGAIPVIAGNGNSAFSQCSTVRDVIVDSSAQGARQEMLGFGHAWTDSSVTTLSSLDPDLLDQVMRDLFSQDGNNMGFMRHTMGSSDLSGRQYSYDDNGPTFNEGEPDDVSLPNFDLGPDGRAMADMIAHMGDYKSDVFLYGSPWSYPGWTKNNGLFIAPNLLNGYNVLNNSFDANFIPHMVQYFSKYVDAFQERGVTVNGITLENEPLNYQGGYPCMYLDADDAVSLLNNGLGQAMHSRNVTIILYDHNTDQQIYPAREIQRAPEYGDAVGWHCYAGQWGDYSAIPAVNQAFGRPIVQFMTECSTYNPTPTVNFGVGYQLLRPVHYGASGGAYWVLSTNPEYGPHSPYGGCDKCAGSVIVNSPTSYTLTNDYYLLGQFSRFIRRSGRNYQVINGNQGTDGTFSDQFYIIAVQNPDGGWAVVFLNNLGYDENVRLSFTSSGTVWEGTVPNLTVTTWLLPSDKILQADPTTSNTTAHAYAPPYPRMNSTGTTGLTGTDTATSAGTSAATTSISVSSFCSTTGSVTSSPTSSSTLAPVPNTTRTIDWNHLFRMV